LANLLQTGAAWLADQLKSHASNEVIYQRAAEQISVQATIGSTEFEIDEGSGMLQRIQSRDFLIHAADFVLGGEQTLPAVGDRVLETHGELTLIYEVMAPGPEPHWRYSDPFRKLLRIHTKHVATEPA